MEIGILWSKYRRISNPGRPQIMSVLGSKILDMDQPLVNINRNHASDLHDAGSFKTSLSRDVLA